MKPLYEVRLNWYGEIHNMWTHAYSTTEAKLITFSRLAKKLKVESKVVWDYYLKHGDGYNIKEKNK